MAGLARVLVVDDEQPILMLVSTILKRAGFQVTIAAGGVAALQILQQNAEPVDLLLTDIVMPDLDGRVLAARSKELRPQLPILFMTGFRDLADVPGPTLNKPFMPAALVDRVRQMLPGERVSAQG